ncbi:MAG: response regulator [Betaproteobacteria bacterium]|nr:response regulator [Betaproteobacteria bacterium]
MRQPKDDLDARIHAARILVVDDNPDQLYLMELMLHKHHYRNVEVTADPTQVASAYAANPYDLILLDMEMPVMNGADVMRELKSHLKGEFLPVIVLTAHDGAQVRLQVLEAGARDYISKPFVEAEFAHRIRNHLEVRMLYKERERQNEILELKVIERTEELRESQTEILRRLAKAGEFRDNDTGNHVTRVSHSCRALARAAGLDAHLTEMIYMASSLHDIGKIGVPDHILLKKGRLTDDEQVIMRQHVEFGVEMLGNHPAPVLQVACSIAQNHHEKWDGTGYPEGLIGAAIPVEARIVAICDVFDALTSVRPYKVAWTVENAVAFLQENAGSHFDPNLVELFIKILPEIEDIRARFADPVDLHKMPPRRTAS